MVWTDWASVVGRALKQDPPAQGGWHLRVTGTPGALTVSPQTNAGTDMSCARKNFSERLRAAFLEADEAARPSVLTQLPRRLAEVVPYRVLGQSSGPAAYRSNVAGLSDRYRNP
jgi:peptide/nickel transport system substrate-binding protein